MVLSTAPCDRGLGDARASYCGLRTETEWLTQTAAGSTVGRLVLQLARSEGFRTISLVRRRAQVAEIESWAPT